MKGEISVIKDVSCKLMENDIPFMLTGSVAMNYYVEPRMTRDILLLLNTGCDIEYINEACASMGLTNLLKEVYHG